MSLLRTILAITLLVMVTFNIIDYLNIIQARNEITYKTYYAIQNNLNANSSKSDTINIQSQHSYITSKMHRRQSKFKIIFKGNTRTVNFKERLITEQRISNE